MKYGLSAPVAWHLLGDGVLTVTDDTLALCGVRGPWYQLTTDPKGAAAKELCPEGTRVCQSCERAAAREKKGQPR